MKDWFEKEYDYEQLYASGRQAKNIWKYIPASISFRVAEAFSDSDGYWIYLDSRSTAYDGGEDCGVIHEYTIADLKDAIKTIRRKENIYV